MVATEPPVAFKVLDVETKTVTSSSVLLTWRAPPPAQSTVILYRVKYWLVGKEQDSSFENTPTTSAKISKLVANSEYVFRVQGKTNGGWGRYSDPVSVKTPGEEHPKNSGMTEV